METTKTKGMEETVADWSQSEVLELAGRLIEIAREKGSEP